MVKLSDRPIGELMLLLVAGTVCAVVLVSAFAVLVAEIVEPEADTSGAAKTIGDSLSALIALLAGFLAGRSRVDTRDTTQTSTEEGHHE